MTAIPVAGSTPRELEAGAEAPDVVTSSDAYAQRFAGPVGAWFLRVQQEAILRLLASRHISTVLEVGGGHGQLTEALVAHGYGVTVLGSDPSCRRRIQPLIDAKRCRFITADLLKLPYTDRAFDAVVSLRLLPHLPEWQQFIGELSRVAREAVVVDFPTMRSLNCLAPVLFGAKRKLEGDTRPYQTFHERNIVEAFASQGLQCQRRYAQYFWPMALHRATNNPTMSKMLEAPCRAAQLTCWFGSPVIAMFTRKQTT